MDKLVMYEETDFERKAPTANVTLPLREIWRHGLPPKSGTYQVKWDPDERASTSVVITLLDDGTAVWRYADDEQDDPEVYPGEDTPYAVWLDESPLIGRREPLPLVLGR